MSLARVPQRYIILRVAPAASKFSGGIFVVTVRFFRFFSNSWFKVEVSFFYCTIFCGWRGARDAEPPELTGLAPDAYYR